jgi:hypothetical protein
MPAPATKAGSLDLVARIVLRALNRRSTDAARPAELPLAVPELEPVEARAA